MANGLSNLFGRAASGLGGLIGTGLRKAGSVGKSLLGQVPQAASGLLGGAAGGVGSIFSAATNRGTGVGQFDPTLAKASGLGGGTRRSIGTTAASLRGAPRGSQSAGSRGGSILKQTGLLSGRGLLGAGALAVGLGSKLPSAPGVPASAEALRTRAQAGGGPLGQAAQAKALENLGREFNPVTNAEVDAALKQSKLDRRDALDANLDLFRNLGRTDQLNDQAIIQSQAEINARFDEQDANITARLSRGAEQDFLSNQRLAIQQALNIDDETFNQLAQIAQLDVNQIATQLEIDLDKAQTFKETFLNLGSGLLGQAFGNQQSDLQALAQILGKNQ